MADRGVTGPAVPDPRQFQVRAAMELEQLHTLAAGFPLHGLANWTGSRQFSCWHTRDGGLETAGLGHGAHPGPGPYVDVLVSAAVGPDQALERRREVRYATEPPRDEETFRRIDRELLAVQPDEVVIPVEGAPTRFSVWWLPEGWVATTVLGGHRCTVSASRIGPDDVELCRVHDLKPYWDGRRIFPPGS
ncbi:hypothetical protein [Polymorphospora rubra]|uniref:hypothetical protein n=1 Tax=Polymorphospora rubra TaxID=338584 RepID=UPI001BB2FCA0|nr:hypothetical protein [Polymorphospora rubra]